MSEFIRRELPLLLLTLLGIIWAIDMLIAFDPLTTFTTYFYKWATVIGLFLTFIGAINMLGRNIKRATELPGNDPNKYLNIWGIFVFAILVITGIGFPDIYASVSKLAFGDLDLIMGSMLGLWMMSSASRVLRIRNFELTIFSIVSVLILLYRVPLGEAIHPIFFTGGQFIVDTWVTGMNRAMTIGISFGAVAMIIRTLAGLERRVLGID